MFSADLALLPADGGALAAEADSVLELSLAANGGEQALQEELNPVREVVFIDSGVDEYQALLDDLSAGSDGERIFDTVVLDVSSDGINQISSYLAQQQDVSAIHIVSHGSAGEVFLGNTQLNLTTLDHYAESLEGWQQSLTADADILFYGCDLAAGSDGQTLIDSLALLTRADVAASDDLTGHIDSGGDWALEYGRGEIEATIAFSDQIQESWAGTLTNPIINSIDVPLTLTTMAVNAPDPTGLGAVGDLVSSIVDLQQVAGGLDNVDDPDPGALTGIVVTQVNDPEGRLWYSTDSGVNWNLIPPGGTSPNSALLLAADSDTRVYFQANAGYTGYIDNAFNFRAWDQTAGANGDFADTAGALPAPYDGAFSSGQKNIALQVTVDGSNAAPTAVNHDLNETYVVNTPLNLTDIVVSDVDSGKVGVTMTLSDPLAGDLSTPTFGSGQNAMVPTFINGVWNVVGELAGMNDILSNVIFTPNPGYSDAFTITVSISDAIASPEIGVKVMSTSVVNTPPVATPNTVATTEGNGYTFSDTDFTFADAEGDPLLTATLSNLALAGGTLTYSGGTPVFDGNSLTAAELNTLAYTPLDEAVGVPLATFDFTVNDADPGTIAATMSIEVKDPPEVDNSTLVISKGQTVVVTSSMLEVEDLDTLPAGLVYTITFNSGGQFELASAPGSGIVTFTQQQIDDGEIVFVDNGDDIAPTFSFEVTDGEFTIGPVAAEIVFVRDAVWLSTVSDVSGSGVSGLSDWTSQDFLEMGDPGFGLEPGITNGTFSKLFSLSNFTADTGVRLTSLHVVTSTIVIGDSDTVTLNSGDILFTVNGGKPTLGSVTVDKVDVVRFRPDTAGDYSAGTFEIVLKAPINPPLGQDVGGVSLVEKDTWVGDFEVKAGNFLLVETKGNEQVIHYYEVTGAGEGKTTGTLTTLIDGADLNVGADEIMSVHLVSDKIEIGGTTLLPGEVLVSLNNDRGPLDLFAGIELTAQDVVALELLTTTAGITGTTTISSARVVFEGADANLDTGAESIESFSLTTVAPSSFNTAPVANDDGSAVVPIDTPEDTAVVVDVTANDTDADGTIDPTTVTAGVASNGNLSVNPVTGEVTYTPNLNFVGTDSFTYTVRDDQGAVSNSATVYVNVTPVNDAPVGGYSAANIIPAAQIVQATDGSGAVTITWRASRMGSACDSKRRRHRPLSGNIATSSCKQG
jgi:hypothetical protein